MLLALRFWWESFVARTGLPVFVFRPAWLPRQLEPEVGRRVLSADAQPKRVSPGEEGRLLVPAAASRVFLAQEATSG